MGRESESDRGTCEGGGAVLKPTKKTACPRSKQLVVETPAAEKQPSVSEKLTVDLKTDTGHLSVVGTATAVIAALAVFGLIVISIYVVKLAERAIDRTEHVVPAKTVQR
jgi:hypothetical protein